MRTSLLVIVVLALSLMARAAEIEPVFLYDTHNAKGIEAVTWPYCHIKTPGPGMSFTVGVPIRVLADALDPEGYIAQSWNEASEVRFYVDGQLKSTQAAAKGKIDWFEAFLTDVPAGAHVLTVQSTNVHGMRTSFPVPIDVKPMPAHAKTVTLTADLNLSGAQDLDWQDTTVVGKGFKVKAGAGWSGKVIIKNSFITGLGEQTADGINTSGGGAIDIENSIFDGTGALTLHTRGNDPITIKDNEFRANNLIEFVTNNPAKSPVLTVGSSGSGAKVFQGNRVGAGILHFDGPHWLVGGDTTRESNIIIGPRCVIEMAGTDGIVRGNYMHHDYHGGWSQGFNLYGESTGLLAEHNVIRGSSWVVQNLGGELRYNLVIDTGHNWIRTVLDGSKIHHNIFINATGSIVNGSTNSGIWMYGKNSGVEVYNNTFDAQGKMMGLGSPMIEISKGCQMTSVRNNIFYDIVPGSRIAAIVQHGIEEKDSEARVGYADYNCIFNPDGSKVPTYTMGLVTGKEMNTPGFGGHDVKADPQFSKGNPLPYPVIESDLWNGKTTVAQVLSLYRQQFAPRAGSPVLAAGDPADGKGTFIGAIGDGSSKTDLFGKWAIEPAK